MDSEETQMIWVGVVTALQLLRRETLLPHTTPTFAHILVGMIKTCEILRIKAGCTYSRKYPGHLRAGRERLLEICGGLELCIYSLAT